MKAKKIVCLILALMILISICGCGKKDSTILAAPYDSTTQYDFSTKGEVAKVGDYTLAFDDKLGFPMVYKAGTEKKWDASLAGAFTASSIFVELYDVAYDSFMTVKSIDAVFEGRVKSESITNGVKVTYFFDEYEVSVPVYYTLNENGLMAKIVPSEIDEHNYLVMSVSISPFLCNAKNEKNSNRYLFVPSGSGSLLYTDNRGEARNYNEEVYGVDLAREEKWRYNNTQQIHLPVFGAVDGNEAMYGIITSGAEYASIGAVAGDRVLGYSGVYPIFNVRGYNSIEINVGGTTGLKTFAKAADQRNPIDFEVQYYILSGEDASYNGIAKAYREYLGLESGAKNKLLNLTLLGGFMTNRSALGIPYTTFLTTTTISQTSDIVSELYEANQTAMNIRLLGFGKTGLDVNKLAGGFKINGKLGSKSDVKDLEAFCKEIGSDLFIDYDVVQLAKSGSGYSKRRDVVIDTTDFRVKKYEFDVALQNVDTTKTIKYLLARDQIKSSVNDALKSVNKYGVGGISLDTLGRMAYSDYSDIKYYGKGNMDEDVTEMLKVVKDSETKLLTTTSNDYAAVMSDYIDSIPTISSNSDALDVDIPFYGMVFSGCRENSVTINLSSEPRKKFLDAIKTGSGLSFVLAADINSDVITGKFDAYISAGYDANKDNINGYFTEAKDFLNSVSGVTVKTYEILANGITKTVFENGVTVYVNETVNDAVCEGVSVKAMSFKVR